MGSGKYTGDTPQNYFTPSSFCWGDTCDDETTRRDPENIELPGIWVSKFEMTGTIDDISSIPNVTSLRSQTISQYFNGIQNEMNGSSGLSNYGFSGNYDTHMIKNTEWGAFTYLSQSKYGKYGNAKYSGADKEIAPNNCSDSITGIGADTVYGGSSSTTCTINTYETEKGQTASTTGNIYGIYDTSGGAYEYAMGNSNNEISDSGFSSMPTQRYYNLYPSSTSLGFKGDATNADGTEGFYNDTAAFIWPSFPWIMRGAHYGFTTNSGIFNFSIINYYGYSTDTSSTRFVLIKQ